MSYNIAMLYGSVRSERQGIRAVRFLENQLKERKHQVHILDPLELPLPLLDKMYKEYKPGEAPENMEKIAQTLKKADGYIIVTGEYNHSIPPALKNMLDHFQKEYFFKPSGIVAYSAGQFGGMRAAMHLRSVLAELGMPSISIVQSFPKIGKVLDEEGNAQEEYFIKSTNRFLDEFEWYLEALKNQRAKGIPY